jgi:competence protein ComEA
MSSKIYQILNYLLGLSLLVSFFIIFYDYSRPLSDPIKFFESTSTSNPITNNQNSNNQNIFANKADASSSDQTLLTINLIGEITKPGKYQLPAGSIVNDAIDLAGGFTTLANTNAININLASIIYDQQEVNIPSVNNDTIPEPAFALETPIDSSKININTATKEQLQEITGVGESTAQKIIDYRTTNKFDNIEEIMEVKGIGEKTFAKMKDEIIV